MKYGDSITVEAEVSQNDSYLDMGWIELTHTVTEEDLMGQQLHRYENLLDRNFVAHKPNVKWVTDISYIHTAQGVLYLSMIRDLYDSSIMAYKTGTEQTINLVTKTIHSAFQKETVAAELQLHSD